MTGQPFLDFLLVRDKMSTSGSFDWGPPVPAKIPDKTTFWINVAVYVFGGILLTLLTLEAIFFIVDSYCRFSTRMMDTLISHNYSNPLQINQILKIASR